MMLHEKAVAAATLTTRLIAEVSGAIRRVDLAQFIGLFRGQADGLAGLDGGGKVPAAQLPIGTSVQAYDVDLATIATLASNGLLTRTGAGAWTLSVLAGTANKILLTNADGVLGNPTITIPPTFDLSGHTVALPLGTTFGGTELSALIASLAPLPVGAMTRWPTDTPPAGWLVRDGAQLSRTTYAPLRVVILDGPGFVSANFTVTIASPGLITDNGHGFTGGERLRLFTTGALPTPLNTTNDVFTIVNDANSYWLATSEVNAAAGTKINTSGGQSGTHSRLRSLYGIGDGVNTFNLPDDRGNFERNKPASGRAIGTYEADDNRAHTHTVEFTAGNLAGGAGGNMAAGAGSFQNTSSSGGTEARPKNRAYLPIIKYQ